MLVNYSYILELNFILTTHLCCAVCPVVKCKRYDRSDKASRVYSGSNMSNSKRIFQFLGKMPM